METRKYAIGDHVRLRLGSYTNSNPAEAYTISRMLPAMANVWQYRVKRVGDGQERAVDEQQLAKAASVTSGRQSPVQMQREAERIRNTRVAKPARAVTKRLEQGWH